MVNAGLRALLLSRANAVACVRTVVCVRTAILSRLVRVGCKGHRLSEVGIGLAGDLL